METATEFETTVRHIGGMLRTVRDLSKTNNPPRSRVADALLKHIAGLRPEDLGLEPAQHDRAHPKAA